MKKWLCICLCALLIALPLPIAASAAGTTLYIGDSAWKNDSLMPFIEANGKQLVPVSAFAEFAGISVTLSEALGSVLIESDTAYLSLNLSYATCLDETGNISAFPVYRYGGEIYVEPAAVCEKFGLTFETAYAPSGYLCARLRDGGETLSFAELLSVYAASPDAAAQITLRNLSYRTLTGTFMNPVLLIPASQSVNTLIRLLGTHSATFALSPADIDKYAAVLPAVYAAGHTVAYYMSADDSATAASVTAFTAQMRAANEYLFALTGKTARVYVSTERVNSIPDIEGYFKKSCRMNLIADDLQSERIVNMTLSESPEYGVCNFSLSTDADTRQYYSDFFRKFDTYTNLRAMPLTECSSTQ